MPDLKKKNKKRKRKISTKSFRHNHLTHYLVRYRSREPYIPPFFLELSDQAMAIKPYSDGSEIIKVEGIYLTVETFLAVGL